MQAACLHRARAVPACLTMGNHADHNQKGYIMEDNKITQAEVEKFDLSTAEPQAAAVTARVDNDGRALLADLSTATAAYYSMEINGTDDAITAYNAMSNAQESLSEHIGEEIPVRHVYVEVIKCTDEKTGEQVNCPRIVLIAQDGRTFQAVSMGIFGSLKRIFQIFGRPDSWDFSLVVKAKRVKTRNGYYTNTLEAVGTIPD